MSYDTSKYGKIRMNEAAGKGTIHRPTSYELFDDNFERIFGKKPKRDPQVSESHKSLSNATKSQPQE